VLPVCRLGRAGDDAVRGLVVRQVRPETVSAWIYATSARHRSRTETEYYSDMIVILAESGAGGGARGSGSIISDTERGHAWYS
jgi:hypothetical protein